MSISAIGSSSSSGYRYDNSTGKKRSSNEDPLSQAIDALQTGNPDLAAKLKKISDDATALRKSGASEREVRASVKKAMDGLSDTDKTALQSVIGPPPAVAHHRHGHAGPPPSDASESDSGTSTPLDLASYLNSLPSSQNETIVNFLQKLATATGSTPTQAAS